MLQESNLQAMFKGVYNDYNRMYPLAAIWLEIGKPISVVRDGKKTKTVRMALTDCVKVVNGTIESVSDGNDATHELLKLQGTARQDNNEFIIEARNLITNEIETIQLPL